MCGCLLALASACGGTTPGVSSGSSEIGATAPTAILSNGTYAGKTYAEWGTTSFQYRSSSCSSPSGPVIIPTWLHLRRQA